MLLGQLANAAEPYDAGDCQLATAASASRPGSKWQLEPELDLSFLDQYVGRIPAFDLSTYNLSPGDLSAGRNQAQDSFPLLSASGSGWDPVPVAPDFVRDQIHDGLTKDMAHLGRVQAVAAPAFDSSDFDLSGAAEQFFPETRPAGSSSNKPTHKQELARRAQRRHRQKAKERAEEKEAQLASAAAELSNLKAKNQQLHARNILLERLSEMDQQAKNDSQKFGVYDTEADQAIISTIHGTRQGLSAQDASSMQFEQFASLWTDYIRELGRLLVLQGSSTSKEGSVAARLEQVTIETSQLLGIIKSLNLKVYKAVILGRLDGAYHAGARGLTDEQYQFVTEVMHMSDDQIQDALYVRRLYLTRRGLLALEKEALLQKIHQADPEQASAADHLQQAMDVTARLRAIAVEDYTAYLKVACALRRGVCSTAQWAAMIVHSYPFFPNLETWFEKLAEQHGEPSLHDLLSAACSHSLAADWDALHKYIADITSSYHAQYVPGLRARVLARQGAQSPARVMSLHEMLL